MSPRALPRRSGRRDDVRASARDYLRAAAGGLLVGLPLLWTMEVWADGATLSPLRILVLVGLSAALVVAFNAFAGFRRDRTWTQLLIDSVESLGLGAALAAIALLLLGRLGGGLGLDAIAGRVALAAIPVAFGVALASTVLGDEGAEAGGSDAGARGASGALGRQLVGAAGALYFALNIAPTDEVRILAAEATPAQLLAVVAASLVMGLAIVFHADFGSRGRRAASPLRTPGGETAVAYAISLAVSAVLLWAFASTDGSGPSAIVAQVVMLGFVATFGAAAGRLLLAGGGEGQPA